MNENQRNRITEDAWSKLYQRIEQDGLLPQQPSKKNRKSPAVRWAIATVLLLVCVTATLFIINSSSQPEVAMLMLHNGDNEPTLAIKFEDGSIVFMGQQTSLHYPVSFSKDKREVSLQGNAFFEVSKNAERPFSIDTKPVRIEVLGTSFNVDSRDNSQFSLSVKSGEVKVILKKNKQAVNIRAGETAILHLDSLYKTPTVNLDQLSEYLKRIHFKDQQLADVVGIINSGLDTVKLKLSPSIQHRQITVTFSNESPQTMAELICTALSLRSARKGDIIYISEQE